MSDVVEDDHRELEDEHDVSSPLSDSRHDVQDVVDDNVHPDRKPEVENEDDVAAEVVVDDVANGQFDVEDGGGELLEDVHDVDRCDFLYLDGSRQSGMYLTLRATHTGVGLVGQTNEVGEDDVIQKLKMRWM